MGTKKKLGMGFIQLQRRVSQFKKSPTKSNLIDLLEGINNYRKLLEILGFEEHKISKYLGEFEKEIKKKGKMDRFTEDKLVWIRDSIKEI